MAIPGEVIQAIGRAYQATFIAALQAHIAGFSNLFTAENEPEKVSFDTRSGKSFSFDFSGVYQDPLKYRQVFGESKGYRKARELLAEYKLFLAKAYVASNDYPSHRTDFFWFVTNVPFACSEGSDIRGLPYLRQTLRDEKNDGIREIVGDGHIDEMQLSELSRRIGVFILTDSYLTKAELSYTVGRGDTIWSILKRLHAGSIPPTYSSMKDEIARTNNLESADKIKAGSRLTVPWYGLPFPPLGDTPDSL